MAYWKKLRLLIQKADIPFDILFWHSPFYQDGFKPNLLLTLLEKLLVENRNLNIDKELLVC